METESIGFRVRLLARLLTGSLSRRLAPHGVQPGQLPVLLALWGGDDRTQGELARRARIEQPTMANTLRRMERDGLVRRNADPEDRRRTRIRLTDRAREIRESVTREVEESDAGAIRGLSVAETRLLGRLLGRMIQNVSADRAGPVSESPRPPPPGVRPGGA